MICPFCDHNASPRSLHAHLIEQHPDQVRVDDSDANRKYVITCPVCGSVYSQPIKPRLRDSGFLEEFDREIRLVAFDMLVNHLIAEHEERESALPNIRLHGDADATGS